MVCNYAEAFTGLDEHICSGAHFNVFFFDQHFPIIFQLLHEHVAMALTADDEFIKLQSHSGVPQGVSIATDIFNQSYFEIEKPSCLQAS